MNKCKRCGHEWETRIGMDRVPKVCPACKSYRWDKEYKKVEK